MKSKARLSGTEIVSGCAAFDDESLRCFVNWQCGTIVGSWHNWVRETVSGEGCWGCILLSHSWTSARLPYLRQLLSIY